MSTQTQANKLNGQLKVALAPLHPQGRAFKLFIPCDLSAFFRQENISHVQLLQDGDGGLIVVRPIRESELDKVYAKGREIYNKVIE